MVRRAFAALVSRGHGGGTLGMELAVVWMLFLPRHVRLICFCIVTPWEIGVILTANYTFLNYLVLALGFLLLDDRSVRGCCRARLRDTLPATAARAAADRRRARQEAAFHSGSPGEDNEEIAANCSRPGPWFNAARVV
jgi:hypothetical protein